VTAPGPRPGGGGEGRRSVGPDALAALIRAQGAITRVDAAQHILEAMACGLHLADAIKALAEWDAANPSQGIGGAA
jgi:hypothetical protein